MEAPLLKSTENATNYNIMPTHECIIVEEHETATNYHTNTNVEEHDKS